MSSGFYRAFEDKFRGSREVIKARLKVYLPFIEPLKDIYPDASAVDLGCGRGEWLELLGEIGFSAQGVDINDGMLVACRELDLRVQTGEALSFLKNIPDESQAVISGFHLVEHIPFDNLQALVEESLRVLRPAGVLILETPNPENIVVGTSSFYLDPTHQRPIPPQLLSFLPEYYGFNKTKILRLQESGDLTNNDNLCLLNVLNGVSPDYAVIAQKTAEDELLALTNQAFETEYGVTLERLATTYSQQAKQVEAKAEQAELKSQQLLTELYSVYASRSWRITAPLRWFGHQSRRLRQHGLFSRIKALVKKIARPMAQRGIFFVNKRPGLRFRLVSLLRSLGLYKILRPLYLRFSRYGHGLVVDTKAKYSFVASDASSHFNMPGTLSVDELLARIRTELSAHKKEDK